MKLPPRQDICIAIGYGQRVPTNPPACLVKLSREMRGLMDEAVARHPEKAEQLRKWCKSNVGATLLSYLLVDMEQREMLKVRAAVGGSFLALEADGVVLWKPTPEAGCTKHKQHVESPLS